MPVSELVLLIRSDTTPRATILFVPPLFEEANRTRRTIVLAMRSLADKGFAAVLPDLPGQNDSLVATEAVDLGIWRAALAESVATIDGPAILAAIRGGCLIDGLAHDEPKPLPMPAHVERSRDTRQPCATPMDVSTSLDMSGLGQCQTSGRQLIARWRLAPVGGASLLRTLLRARVAADREAGIISTIESLQASATSEPLLLAGNLLSPTMIAQLAKAEPAAANPLRTVTLGSSADAITGTPLWLRAEPGEDQAMATAIADDIAAWSQACGVI